MTVIDRAEPTLPFFDDEPAGPVAQVAGTRGRPYTVSEINGASRDLLEEAYPDVWIQGEISNFKPHGSGHCYFSLKDARSQINAVMFRGATGTMRFSPTDGLSVLARGRVTVYEARGSFQMVVQWMEPLGIGSLQIAFERLKAKLKAEGLFDPERKRPIPSLPRRVGVVTSPTGAALRDILRVLHRRAAGVHVLIAPCRVQGEGAAGEIVAAIEALNAFSDRGGEWRLDALIVGRGGGSIEDLWAFNEEAVARAIAASGVPVISAVGHEVDFTIADFVADLRAPTPSAAAEMVVRSAQELVAKVSSARTRLNQAARYLVLHHRTRLQAMARSRAFTRVESRLASAQQRRDEAQLRLTSTLHQRLILWRQRLGIAAERLSPRSLRVELSGRRAMLGSGVERLNRAMDSRRRRLRETLGSLEGVLRTLSPLAVLERGYAICQDGSTGAVITSAANVMRGDEVRVLLARGQIGAKVDWTRPAVAHGPEAGTPGGKR